MKKTVSAVLALAALSACGGRAVVDPDGGCLLTGEICDAVTGVVVGTCTYDRCAPPPVPSDPCSFGGEGCPIPDTTCEIEPGVMYVVACPADAGAP